MEDAAQGGYTARALGHSIFTEADSREDLKSAIRDAVRCHFDEGELLDLIRLVETFGFFLLHLDIRQESGRHTEAVVELCTRLGSCEDYRSLDEQERIALLCRLLDQPRQPAIETQRPGLSEETRETLEVLELMAGCDRQVSF